MDNDDTDPLATTPPSSKRATLTVPEAARVLGISRDAAYKAVARGEIPALRVGRRYLVPVGSLERMLDIEASSVIGS